MSFHEYILKIKRKWKSLPEPKVTRQMALDLAKEACKAKGWYWEEPVNITEELCLWRVYTAAKVRGGNVAIQIDNQDGRILVIVKSRM